MKKLLYVLLPLVLAGPLQAAESGKSLQDEVIYRVHLGRAQDVELLLTKEVSPHITNSEGIPLLALAASRGDAQSIPVMETLLAAGADINGKDSVGRTALFHAARVNNKESVLFLMEKGIDYYSVDNNGDIARTIAHNEGYGDLVKAMDAFVVAQSKKVGDQYLEYNRILQQRYDEQRRIVEKHERLREEALEDAYYEAFILDEQNEAEYEAALAEMERLEEERQAAIIKKRSSPEFEQSMLSIAYHMCAYQYWSFAKILKQTTEIKEPALTQTIDTHYANVVALRNMVMPEFQLDHTYVDTVIERAQKRIYVELQRMPSKTYRFEHGVGKVADVQQRCGQVAKYWNNELSKYEKNFGKKNRTQPSDAYESDEE
ncbi:MAG: ankyrin repeat domain-containing protein [Alphaproteobacteria bacterium]